MARKVPKLAIPQGQDREALLAGLTARTVTPGEVWAVTINGRLLARGLARGVPDAVEFPGDRAAAALEGRDDRNFKRSARLAQTLLDHRPLSRPREHVSTGNRGHRRSCCSFGDCKQGERVASAPSRLRRPKTAGRCDRLKGALGLAAEPSCRHRSRRSCNRVRGAGLTPMRRRLFLIWSGTVGKQRDRCASGI